MFIFPFFSPVDLISGFNTATVNHDARIDWLEVRIILHVLSQELTFLLKLCLSRSQKLIHQ